MTQISFPGLGIEQFEIDPAAFTIGESFSVFWYGIIITCGIIFAFCYTLYRSKNERIDSDKLIDVALWTVILGVIGARLYYVITADGFFDHYSGFGEKLGAIFNLRTGGLAIYGGIICGCAGVIISSKIKKINTFKLLDAVGPGVMMAQAIGRWGNFVNGEAHGGIVSEGHPLYFLRMGLGGDVCYHPTFLYESLWNIVGFILINILYKKKKFNGQAACMYLCWYGFGRMFIEGLRTDSLYVGSFRISQVVGFLCFIIFGGLLVFGLIYSRKFSRSDATLTKLDKLLIPDLDDKPERLYHVIKKKITAKKQTKN